MSFADLNASQRTILDLLKYGGSQTILALATRIDLNVETVRSHLKGLVREGLVRREGSRSQGRGRPEIVYGLTYKAEAWFPRREAEVLRRLAAFLKRTDHLDLLESFFDEWLEDRRAAALARVAHLSGDERLDAVAELLSDYGFMAVVDREAESPRLRLCHCPLLSLVEETKVPCRAEIGFVTELLGEKLARETYIPAGDSSCSYRRAES
jgi:predicted ArsR family transcriptional regulator